MADLAKVEIDLSKLSGKERDKAILRTGIMAELEAINLYEQMASMAGNELIRQALLEIAREEKTHVGEFLSLLTEIDREQAEELKKGEAEVRELREKLSS